jgi:DNA primase catalytic core
MLKGTPLKYLCLERETEMTVLEKPDIVEIISEYVPLKKTAQNYKGLCPFHAEKHPSFIVDPSKQNFHCFGCNEHGDVITFIQKYKDISFKDALAYLGIDKSKKYKPNPREIRKRELVKHYRQWLNNYTDFLCNVLRRLDIAKLKAKTMMQVEAMAFHYHSEPIWEQHFEILLSKDEIAKLEIYKEVMYGKSF